jgi:hypothetical protein
MFRKITLTALVVLAASTLAIAGEAQYAKGKVQGVSGNEVTLTDEDGQVWTFEVAEGTKVVAVGAGHRAADLAAVGKKRAIREFVRDNELVTIQYWEEDGTRYIKTMRIH